MNVTPSPNIIDANLRSAAPQSDISFRIVDRAHGSELLDLNRACPITADFTFYFDRSPDFFRWPDQNFDDYRYAGIFRRESLVGYCMVGWRSGWTDEGWGVYSYAGDARVLPLHRGARLTERALEWLVHQVPTNCRIGTFLIKTGNEPALAIARRFKNDYFAVAPLCGFQTVNIPLVRAVPAANVCHVRTCTAAELPDVARFLKSAYEGRLFAPLVTEAGLRSTSRSDVFRLYVAERDGRCCGTLALRDMDAERRTRILRYSWRGKILYHGLHLAGRFRSGLAALPRPGEAFRALTATHVAVENGDPAVLRDLLAAAVREYLGRGYHLLHIGFADGDALLGATRGLLAQRFKAELFVARRKGYDNVLPGGTPYVDLAML